MKLNFVRVGAVILAMLALAGIGFTMGILLASAKGSSLVDLLAIGISYLIVALLVPLFILMHLRTSWSLRTAVALAAGLSLATTVVLLPLTALWGL